MLRLLAPEFCIACGAAAGSVLCGRCRQDLRPIADGALGVFPYEGPAGALVRALKFHGRRSVAAVMAAHLIQADAIGRGAVADGLVVVPAPGHRAHVRRRGLDHALLLARAFATRAGLECRPCLERLGDPLPQVGRGRSERVRGPAGLIRIGPGTAAPPSALLVDDVVTTGSTLRACAEALRVAGTAEISAIAYARTTAR